MTGTIRQLSARGDDLVLEYALDSEEAVREATEILSQHRSFGLVSGTNPTTGETVTPLAGEDLQVTQFTQWVLYARPVAG